MLNRLQFLHKDRVFYDQREALNYLSNSDIKSLYSEPIIMKYGNEDNPSLLLIIGKDGDGVEEKRDFFVIDNAQVLKDIDNINAEIAKVKAATNIVANDTETLDMSVTKTSASTIIQGDVKLAKYNIIDGELDITKKNILKTNSEGLFTYVNLSYADNKLTFTVNDKVSEFNLEPEDYVVSAFYDSNNESLVFTRKSGVVFTCNMGGLIDEWTVEGEYSTTPIVLTKERIIRDKETNLFQDILRGTIRIADDIEDNILEIDRSGKSLYVKGTADNIMFDETTTVKKAIENRSTRISNDDANIIFPKVDGVYANVNLAYESTTNTLTFTRSKRDGSIENKAITLAGVELIDHIDYHPSTKILEIYYKDNTGTLKKVEIDMADLLTSIDWVPQNDGHNVIIKKVESDKTSNQQVSADVRILDANDNILTEVAHNLYVKGTADNIAYDAKNTVKDKIDTFTTEIATIQTNAIELATKEAEDRENIEKNSENISQLQNSSSALTDALAEEVERATTKETALETAINNNTSAITTNAENITKVEGKVDDNTDSINAINDKIGGNYTVHDTVADAIAKVAQNVVDEVRRAQTKEGALQDSIDDINTQVNTNKTDIATLKTNTKINVANLGHTVKLVDQNENGHTLSADVVLDPKNTNILTTTVDGIFANVDINYDATTNKLTFTTSNGATKEYTLVSNSLVKKIYYDPLLECIVFVYVIDGKEQTMAVNVRDLINEWTVSNTDTVKLTKQLHTSGDTPTQDILTADVVICPASIHPDNILTKDNGLYVSGQQIAENTNAIGELTILINGIDDAITAETAARIASDAELNTKISEISRGTSGFTSELNKEIQNRIDADAQITTNYKAYTDAAVNNEKTARQLADEQLATTLDTAKDNIAENASDIRNLKNTTTSLSGALTTEVLQRQNSDTNFTNEITNLKTSATKASNDILALQQVDANLSGSIRSEIQERQYNDNIFTTDIAALKTSTASTATALNNLQNADKTLSDSIRDEVRNRTLADQDLSTELKEYADNLVDGITKYTFVTTPSVKLTSTADGKVSADVLTANSNDNIIKASADSEDGTGIYAKAELSYNPGTNVLTFTNTNGSTPITLNAGSIIDSMEVVERDGVKYIVITYKTTAGGGNKIEINVGDLLSEIKALNKDDEPIWLTVDNNFSGGGTSISAHVILSTAHNDNILTKDGNNGLYVSGAQIEANKLEIENLKTASATYQAEIDAIENACGLNNDGTYNSNLNLASTYLQNSDKLATADLILDKNLSTLSGTVETLSEKLDDLSVEKVGANGSYIKYIEQNDGKIVATPQEFDTTIDNTSSDTNAPTSHAVQTFVTSYTETALSGLVDTLNAETVGDDNTYIQQISEENGVISAIAKTFVSEVNDTTKDNNNAPSTKAVYNFVDEYVTKYVSSTTESLSADTIGGNEGAYIYAVSEKDGILSAATKEFDTELLSASTNAPQTKVVFEAFKKATDGKNGIISATTGEYVNLVHETDGVVSGTVESFASDVTSGNPIAPSSDAIYSFVDNYVKQYVSSTTESLSADTIGGNEGEYIYAVSEKDGILSAATKEFDSELLSASTNAPQTKVVYQAIQDVIEGKVSGLDGGVSATTGQFIRIVTEEDGVVSGNVASFKTTINSGDTDAPSSNAVYTFVTSYVDNYVSSTTESLSADTIGGNEGAYIYAVSEKDGILSAVTKEFEDILSQDSTNAPQTKVVYQAIKNATDGKDGIISATTGEYVNLVHEVNGVISGTVESFASDVTSGNPIAPSSDAIYSFVDNYVKQYVSSTTESLSADTIGGNEGAYIYAVSEKDGILSAATKEFDSELLSASTNAPQTKVVFEKIVEDERVTAEALNTIKDSTGLDENGHYIVNEGSKIISGSSDVTESVNLLAEYLESCDTNVEVRGNGYFLTGFEQKNGKIISGTDIQFASEVTSGGTIAPAASAVYNYVNGASYWNLNGSQLEPKNSGYTVAAKSFYETSDKNAKHDIKTINSEDVKKSSNVELKEFVFNGDTVKKYGVIAQEVESAGLTNLVNTDEAGKKSVDYISLLILKIQELENRIKELENK